MRYWAAGLLLTVLLFGGAYLAAGGPAAEPETAAPETAAVHHDGDVTLTRDRPAKMRDKPPPMRTRCCGYGTGSRWWR